MSRPRDTEFRHSSSLSEALPRVSPDLIEAKARALLGALGALEFAIGRRLLPPQTEELHPAFEILLSLDREGTAREAPPPQAFDRLLGEGCSFRLESLASGPLSRWLRLRGGGMLCGWALPRDRWPSVALLARVPPGWDPGPVRLRVAQRGMEALARELSPPSWWLGSSSSAAREAWAAEEAPAAPPAASLREAKLHVERELIRQALRSSRGNKSEAARRLQLSRQGLYRKLRRHELQGDA